MAHATFQIFIDNEWRDAASLELTGLPEHGLEASTYLAYLTAYLMDYFERTDAAALSANVPVSLAAWNGAAWPAFAVDLLPQGFGRIELLRQLKRDEKAGPVADWDLLMAGAGNPIGNLRVKQAHDWVSARSGNRTRGFTVDEVVARAEDFNEYLAQHGLFVAGSSGVQGEWPKILLTQAHDGLFYLDHMLPDDQAREHFIVKFGRGSDAQLAAILALEAPYMQLAKHLGLNVHRDLIAYERALFIPRFDREAAHGRVRRHGQESIASLCGISGFRAGVSHNDVCAKLGAVCSDPVRDIIEYLKRDIANIALGNKDNHARNTAIQRRDDGAIGLTPLFDFAPMWLHPDGIARRIRWDQDDHGSPLWASAIGQACASAGVRYEEVVGVVRAMAGPLRGLVAAARELGVGPEHLDRFEPGIDNICKQLEEL